MKTNDIIKSMVFKFGEDRSKAYKMKKILILAIKFIGVICLWILKQIIIGGYYGI